MEAKLKTFTVFQVIGAISLILHVATITILLSTINVGQPATFLENLGAYLFISLLIVSTTSMFCITLGVKNGFSIPSLVLFALLYIGAETLPPPPSPLMTTTSTTVVYVIIGALVFSLIVNIIDRIQVAID